MDLLFLLLLTDQSFLILLSYPKFRSYLYLQSAPLFQSNQAHLVFQSYQEFLSYLYLRSVLGLLSDLEGLFHQFYPMDLSYQVVLLIQMDLSYLMDQ